MLTVSILRLLDRTGGPFDEILLLRCPIHCRHLALSSGGGVRCGGGGFRIGQSTSDTSRICCGSGVTMSRCPTLLVVSSASVVYSPSTFYPYPSVCVVDSGCCCSFPLSLSTILFC